MRFHWAVDELCVLPLSPQKDGSKLKFLHFALPFTSSLQVIVYTSNFESRLVIASPSLRTPNCPWNGRGHFKFQGSKHSSGITEAIIVKFFTQVGCLYIKLPRLSVCVSVFRIYHKRADRFPLNFLWFIGVIGRCERIKNPENFDP